MILVTGGTGLVGAHLLYFLTKENDTVRAIYRVKSNFDGIKRVFSYYTKDPESLFRKIEWIEATLTDVPSLTNAFKGVTHVYHAAANISFNPKHYSTLKKTNVEGSANIVNLCLAHDVIKLCHVSSVATLGTTTNGTLSDEETPWNPEENNSVYAITKFGAEMEVWRGAQEGLSVAIVNPGVILGEGFWNSGSGAIFKRVHKGLRYYFPGGVGVIDVRDVVSLLMLLMTKVESNPQYITVNENISYKKLLSQIAVSLNTTSPNKEMARWKINFISTMDWLSSTIFGTSRALPRSLVASMYTQLYYDTSKLKAAFDFDFIPLEETITRVSKHYLDDNSYS